MYSRSWLVSCQIFEILQTVSDLLNPGSWNKTDQAEEGKRSRDRASELGIRGNLRSESVAASPELGWLRRQASLLDSSSLIAADMSSQGKAFARTSQ